MNKHLKRFLAIMVGCSVIVGGATFAGEKAADQVKVIKLEAAATTENMDDWSDEDFEGDLIMFEFDGDLDDFDYPETGVGFVNGMVEYYDLTDAEKTDIEKLYDEAIALEEAEEADWKKAEEKWVEIDNILLKYEKIEILGEDVPALSELLEDMGIEESSLTDAQTDELEDLHKDLEKYKKAEDADKLYNAYEALFNWMDENIEETQWCEIDEECDFDDFEDMTEEEFNQMIFDEIKEYTADDLLSEIPFEIEKDDADQIKSIYDDMVKAADGKDMDKIDELYEDLEVVFEKYEDEFEKYYDEMDFEDYNDEDFEDEE